jgi:UDP-N-acetylglucosamine diphosphorylase/glucosamine-1-phosphate N-acetyltransferase
MTGIILAAGKSKRAGTKQPKVLLPLKGRPVLDYVLETCQKAGVNKIIIVVGDRREQIEQAFAHCPVTFVFQKDQKGTADAVLSCREEISDAADVVVLSGDVPLLSVETLRRLIAGHQQGDADLTLLTALVADPRGYGRIVRGRDGRILDIIEERDATPAQREIKEMNVGLYALRWRRVLPLLEQIKPSSVSGEYYLTRLAALVAAQSGRIGSVATQDPAEFMGINTREEHRQVERELERRQCAS